MIRTFFTPNDKQITLSIPEKYVGEKLEIIVFPVKDAYITPNPSQKKPIFGCAKGKFKMSNDFDDPLEDFMEYMQ
jgi:hypothetical protein